MTPVELITELASHGFTFITGVPDSLFNHLIATVTQDSRFQHVITNNEGESCAVAAGYHLATGNVPVVYMQNSGLGNCINPLTSLLDEWVYSIPVLLLISWRGKPGEIDEPQHRRMGAILLNLLTLLDIPYVIVDANIGRMKAIFSELNTHFNTTKKPFALIFHKDILTAEKSADICIDSSVDGLLREQILMFMVKNSQKNDIFVTTTGKTSRELYDIRERLNQEHDCDFLTVGSMGCAASIALGIAIKRSDRRVIVVDGDGACLMRLEALATIGHVRPSNMLHVLIDNHAYESTGSQKTQSEHIDFTAIALACAYRQSAMVQDMKAFETQFLNFVVGPSLLVVKTNAYSRDGLGRPKTLPIVNKQKLMQHLGVS